VDSADSDRMNDGMVRILFVSQTWTKEMVFDLSHSCMIWTFADGPGAWGTGDPVSNDRLGGAVFDYDIRRQHRSVSSPPPPNGPPDTIKLRSIRTMSATRTFVLLYSQ